jgi:soluble lytic murein transglycosylase-like protein
MSLKLGISGQELVKLSFCTKVLCAIIFSAAISAWCISASDAQTQVKAPSASGKDITVTDLLTRPDTGSIPKVKPTVNAFDVPLPIPMRKPGTKLATKTVATQTALSKASVLTEKSYDDFTIGEKLPHDSKADNDFFQAIEAGEQELADSQYFEDSQEEDQDSVDLFKVISSFFSDAEDEDIIDHDDVLNMKPKTLNAAEQKAEQKKVIPPTAEKPIIAEPAMTVHEIVKATAPPPSRNPFRTHGPYLSDRDSAIYKGIFKAQAKADWKKADALISELTDYRIRGHVLFQRYMHPTEYVTTFDELNTWLTLYHDHPNAGKIYKLARSKQPKSFKGRLQEPTAVRTSARTHSMLLDIAPVYRSKKKRSKAQIAQIKTLTKKVSRYVSAGSPTKALSILNTPENADILDTVEYDQILAHIARGYMTADKLHIARELAVKAADRSGQYAPMAGWVGGLVTWRLGEYKTSASLFENTANSEYVSSWTISAAAYWASRAHMRAGQRSSVSKWLKTAAEHPRTFYGLIATRALGWDYDFDWNMPEFTEQSKELLLSEQTGLRATALIQSGQFHLAEEELRQLMTSPEHRDAIIAYSHSEDLPSLSMRIAETTLNQDNRIYDAAHYPLSPWTPVNGFEIDRALINAFIRQESRFRPYAENRRSGASGLMQLMPQTARYIANKSAITSVPTDSHMLKDPQINLDIGQTYLTELLNLGSVDDNLFSLAIAYNAGPGNLRKWKDKYWDTFEDPLLFVETIPMPETRAFVERVMANLWIYRMRLKQSAPSLDSVVQGGWPQYVKLDKIEYAKSELQIQPGMPRPVSKPYEFDTVSSR